jgi:hypothetical protein
MELLKTMELLYSVQAAQIRFVGSFILLLFSCYYQVWAWVHKAYIIMVSFGTNLFDRKIIIRSGQFRRLTIFYRAL